MSTKQPQSIQIDGALEHIAASRGASDVMQAFLDVAPGLVDTHIYGMYMLDGAARTDSVRAANAPSGFIDAYEEFGRANDSLFRHIAAYGEATHDGALFAARAWAREPVGNFLREWGVGHVIQAPVGIDGVLQATLHFARPKVREPFRQADLRVAALIARQVAQQLRWVRTEHELSQMREVCASLIEQIRVPAVVTTESGALAQANDAAQAMLLCYRAAPQLWDEYALAIRRNAEQIVAHGSDAGGTATARRGVEGVVYLVRTTTIQRSGLLLSLFQPSTGAASARRSGLAAREQVIACLVAEGQTNDRIATTLDLSVNTIKDHLKRINRKLGTTNRAQVAAWAQRNLPRMPEESR